MLYGSLDGRGIWGRMDTNMCMAESPCGPPVSITLLIVYGWMHGMHAQSCLTLRGRVGGTHQAPLSMEFSRQEYWNGLPFPTPGDLFQPVIEPVSPASPALTGRFLFLPLVPPGKLSNIK